MFQNSKTNYNQLQKVAERLGANTSALVQKIASAENINEVIEILTSANTATLSELGEIVQTEINKTADIGLAPVNIDSVVIESRKDGLKKVAEKLNAAEKSELIPKTSGRLLEEFTRDIPLEYAKCNAEELNALGLRTAIVRKPDANACKWCLERVGTFEYAPAEGVNSEIFRRHANCGCSIEMKIYKH